MRGGNKRGTGDAKESGILFVSASRDWTGFWLPLARWRKRWRFGFYGRDQGTRGCVGGSVSVTGLCVFFPNCPDRNCFQLPRSYNITPRLKLPPRLSFFFSKAKAV
jgi:hypothetical protein